MSVPVLLMEAFRDIDKIVRIQLYTVRKIFKKPLTKWQICSSEFLSTDGYAGSPLHIEFPLSSGSYIQLYPPKEKKHNA